MGTINEWIGISIPIRNITYKGLFSAKSILERIYPTINAIITMSKTDKIVVLALLPTDCIKR